MHAAAALGGLMALGGCTMLPSAGPLATEVESTQGLRAPYDAKGYVLVDVTQSAVSRLAAVPSPPAFPAGFRANTAGNPAVGIGDGLTIAIWEAGSGGLFTSAPLEGFSTGARNVILPEQIVSEDGDITVPYAGRVHVAGQSIHQIEDAVEQKLQGKAIEPQVTVFLAHSLSGNVSIMGDVTSGGRVAVGPAGMRVADAIATVGGLHIPPNEAMVQISRDGKTASVPFLLLTNDPVSDILLAPGDIVTVLRQPKNVTALGATGRNAVVPFETVTMSLNQAIAKSGGLLDERANPAGVYVFRYEPLSLAAQLAPSQVPAGLLRSLPPETEVPVVFHLDLGSVPAYFLSLHFMMQDKDVVYVSNARLSQIQKFLQLLNTAVTPAVTGVTIGNAVK